VPGGVSRRTPGTNSIPSGHRGIVGSHGGEYRVHVIGQISDYQNPKSNRAEDLPDEVVIRFNAAGPRNITRSIAR
jgi:hypothetical protein